MAPPALSCVATPTTVHPGETSTIRCYEASPWPLTYAYSTTAGTIEPEGEEATLNVGFSSANTVIVRASAIDDKGESATTSVGIIVAPYPAPSAAAAASPIEETGRNFLLSAEKEKAGYGLYSYLLWGSTPRQQDRQRYLRVISAFLSISPVQVEEGAVQGVNAEGKPAPIADALAPTNLNVAYIPVNAVPPARPTAAWVLDNYDVARARLLLERVPKTRKRPGGGPYIISVLRPLQTSLSSSDHYLYQDLSSPSITDDLAYQWVQLFQAQASKMRFWQPDTMTEFVLGVRDQVGQLADAIPAAKAGLATWIQWLGPSPQH